MSIPAPRRIVCALFLMLAGAACGDSGGSAEAKDAGGDSATAPQNGEDAALEDAAPPAGEVTFTMLYDEVFSDSITCSSFYCHAGGGQGLMMTGLDTSKKDALYDLLVNQDASDNCPGWKRVVPGDPDKSLLLQKLGASPPCGVRMPKDMEALSASQIARIRSWIQDGAKND